MTWTIPAGRSLRTGGPVGEGRRPGGRRARPRLESLESRALLSGVEARLAGSSDAPALVTRLYEGLLHRAPDPAGEAYWARQLDAGRPIARVAQRFLVSREYAAAHPTAQSFIEG